MHPIDEVGSTTVGTVPRSLCCLCWPGVLKICADGLLLISLCRCLPGAQDADGDSALHNAARGGHLDVVQYLLQRGADPTLRNEQGKTAAAEAEDKQVVAALVLAAQQRQPPPQQQQGKVAEAATT